MNNKQKNTLVALLISSGIFSSGIVATTYVKNLSEKQVKLLIKSLKNSEIEKAIYVNSPTTIEPQGQKK